MVEVLRKKDLEMLLSRIDWSFPSPKRLLEQYTTPPHIAADIAWEAFMRGDIAGRRVADIGAGTGILSYAAAVLGAVLVLSIEVDGETITRLYSNLSEFAGRATVCIIRSDARHPVLRRVDTVLMNPPFGVVREHSDTDILRAVLGSSHKIYSLHKSTPGARRVLCRLAASRGYRCTVLKTYKYPIPQIYQDHYKRIHYTLVDLYVLEVAR